MRIQTKIGMSFAVALLAGCASMHEAMHDTMHGGGDGGDRVTLTGAHEVPPVQTAAEGHGMVTVGADCSVKVHIKVTGMQPTAAHVHEGAMGVNGKVIVPLVKEGEDTFVSKPDARLDAEQCAAYKSGNTYVNVHSDAHKGGEIRAQLKGH
jgi:hypothetical protein